MGAMQYIKSAATPAPVPTRQGPRDWFRQTAGAAAPSGAGSHTQWATVGATLLRSDKRGGVISL